ncbi:F0F1 ATP synthase subunit alpha [Mesomycoplasma ovipneumoniae]|uniref:ATP synthase subunit alpha n=1 Tax=Mesomycoplasma ovipneumoniae TaxID=29562 RepID=A0AAJ2UD49_9BACT|nr:F0F1 ATP synthase subunit alpha [Mesomycoplasma ovipneumoniae]MDW2829497.1 F0F1 ATP synthase subunit alpha [Mesomycoplasma ovipneumoniae]MDW2834646.1 F0F1 ATP synthase subunit alpha [Mesomycoplasma ovipneumoniae]MDW2870853.1 F0F1 ATP synthase subunit alpha [Mesomycoplasma ovipneumoniae]MDW2891061.1 F0F1 ATP synthase subunit alpha [Mesomycoplasma ovipneumoniae]MDW2893404.1 F0F1 ATP synthase subunit alpha [Mesomycoplasma ovipneumoniae]
MNKDINLTAIIKNEIKNFESKIQHDDIGKVIVVGDGVALVSGIEKVKFGELVQFENGVFGIALNLEQDLIGVVIMGNENSVFQGSTVKRTKSVISITVGDQLLGRVVNALGLPIDGKGEFDNSIKSEIFTNAPSIMDRKSVDRGLQTGILAIDSLVPIGKGQRELIIGDRQTGKTTIAIDTILNQKGKNVYCVYVAIGQKNSSVAQIVALLEKKGALDYTAVVVSGASELSPLQYLAPYSGTSIAEYWMHKGKDVLIIYDDLSKHAIAYRTLSLLLRRPPGREAFPGDIFYQHSYLLERSSQLSDEKTGGSITALPIIETQAGDISAYIPTNVISITDGQIFVRDNLFNSGQKPAIDIGLSVSRVGSAAQSKLMKWASSSLKLELAQYNELKAFAQFGSDLGPSSQLILDRGNKIYELLKQENQQHFSQIQQIMMLILIKEHLIDHLQLESMQSFKSVFLKYLDTDSEIKSILEKIDHNVALKDDDLNLILNSVTNLIENFNSGRSF